jgi:hypothetical protein
MKDFVVCINNTFETRSGRPMPAGPHPVKGVIYQVEAIEELDETFYHLRGFDRGIYQASSFRPVDNTYGELITEILEKQIELEPATN